MQPSIVPYNSLPTVEPATQGSLVQRVRGLFRSCCSNSLSQRAIQYVKRIAPAVKYGAYLTVGSFGLVYIIYGGIGIVNGAKASDWMELGQSILQVSIGIFESMVCSYGIPKTATERMIAHKVELVGALGGSTGAYFATDAISSVALEKMASLPSLAAHSIGYVVDGLGAVALGSLATGAAIALLEGGIEGGRRLRQTCSPRNVPAAEVQLLPLDAPTNANPEENQHV